MDLITQGEDLTPAMAMVFMCGLLVQLSLIGVTSTGRRVPLTLWLLVPWFVLISGLGTSLLRLHGFLQQHSADLTDAWWEGTQAVVGGLGNVYFGTLFGGLLTLLSSFLLLCVLWVRWRNRSGESLPPTPHDRTNAFVLLALTFVGFAAVALLGSWSEAVRSLYWDGEVVDPSVAMLSSVPRLISIPFLFWSLLAVPAVIAAVLSPLAHLDRRTAVDAMGTALLLVGVAVATSLQPLALADVSSALVAQGALPAQLLPTQPAPVVDTGVVVP